MQGRAVRNPHKGLVLEKYLSKNTGLSQTANSIGVSPRPRKARTAARTSHRIANIDFLFSFTINLLFYIIISTNKKFLQGPGTVFTKRVPGRRRRCLTIN